MNDRRKRLRRAAGALALAGATALPTTSHSQIIMSNNVVVLSNLTQTAASGTNYFLGKVGIGTNNPTAKLHVVGDMTVSGALQVPRQGDVDMGPYTNGLSAAGASGVSGVTASNVCFEVCKTNGQTIASNQYVKVVWDLESCDVGGGFNLASNAFIPPVAGYYVFHAATRLEADPAKVMRMAIYNGASCWRETRSFNPVATATQYVSQVLAAGPAYLTPADAVSLYVYHASGGSRTLAGNGTMTFFGGHMLPARVLTEANP
jgi:hypothetical protein